MTRATQWLSAMLITLVLALPAIEQSPLLVALSVAVAAAAVRATIPRATPIRIAAPVQRARRERSELRLVLQSDHTADGHVRSRAPGQRDSA